MTAPNAYYTQFDSSTPLVMAASTGTSSADWVDAGTTVYYDNSIGNIGSERWETNLQTTLIDYKLVSIVSDSAGSTTSPINPTYYHQYMVSFGYTSNDGTPIISRLHIVTYKQTGVTTYLDIERCRQPRRGRHNSYSSDE